MCFQNGIIYKNETENGFNEVKKKIIEKNNNKPLSIFNICTVYCFVFLVTTAVMLYATQSVQDFTFSQDLKKKIKNCDCCGPIFLQLFFSKFATQCAELFIYLFD